MPLAAITPDQFTAFGPLLRYLRERAGLTQTELSAAVDYSPAQISRFEHGHRPPDAAVLAARFVPALGLTLEPAWAARLLALAAGSARQPASPILHPPTDRPTPHNLPADLTAFIGREHELVEIARRLADPAVRLLTLTGTGGMGKTRLAVQAATGQLARFRDGVWFVPLAPVPAPELVVYAVAGALALHPSGEDTPRQALLRYLRERAALLVLDNFEHVLVAAELLAEILQRSPRVQAVVTSREPLGLPGEWIIRLAGLEVPSSAAETSTESPAVRLFVESGQRTDSGFALTPDNRAALHRLCRMVEGMPLALELAAAWLPVLPLEAIADEIERGLGILSASAAAIEPRHRSVRAVFDQTWARLSNSERAAFRRLAVFRGGFTREAAHAIAGAGLTDLVSLLSKALIRRSGTRYDLHELLRQYGLEHLEAAGETQSLRARHLAYFVALATKADAVSTGPEEVAADHQLQEELDNVRGALSHALEHDAAAGLSLAGALGFFWPRRNLREGHGWLLRLLEQPGAAGATAARAKALLALAQLFWQTSGDFDRAQGCAETALEIYRSVNDERGAAWVLCRLGWMNPDFRLGLDQLKDSLAEFRRLGDLPGQATALWLLGYMLTNSDVNQARGCLTTSLALCRQLSWLSGTFVCLTALGRAAMLHGEFDEAWSHLAQALDLGSAISGVFDIETVHYLRAELSLKQGHYDQAEADFQASIAEDLATERLWYVYWSQTHLGYVKVAKGEFADAQALFAASLRAFHLNDTRSGLSYVCEGLAGLALAQAEPTRAVRLIAWADHTRLTENDVRPPVEQRAVDGVLAAARAMVGEAEFAAAWAAGGVMTKDEVLAYALSIKGG